MLAWEKRMSKTKNLTVKSENEEPNKIFKEPPCPLEFLGFLVLVFFFKYEEEGRDAIIKENPVKSGFLQITLTPPPKKIFWNSYFLACPDFQIYPPPWFSGTSGFYIAKFHV